MPAAAMTPVELPPRYYLENFRQLCSVVEQRYGDLLQDDEQQWLEVFGGLTVEAQCLYLRLLMRVGPDFRSDRLRYPEVGEPGSAIAQLKTAGLIRRLDSLPLEQLGALYTRPELSSMYAGELALPVAASKSRIMSALTRAAPSAESIYERVRDHFPGDIVSPLHAQHLVLFQLLFFGNRRQSLTDFILSDLGLFRYFPYPLNDSERYFSDRSAVDEYLQLGAVSDQLEERLQAAESALDLQQLARVVLASQPVHRSSLRRYYRLCNRLGRELERSGDLASAQQCYERSRRHPARERYVRICEREGDWEGVVQRCQCILDSPWCEAELEAVRRILPRVLRKLGRKSPPRARDSFPRRDLELPVSDERVESAAARWYAREWPLTRYVENTLLNGLFGLAFWEVLFSDQPGVWFHPFQDAPADLNEPDFMRRRHALFEGRFAELAGPDRAQQILAAFHEFRGYRCRWINWSYLDEELLRAALSCIPWSHLEALWRRQLFDLQENRSGLPDLILLDPEQGRYCLVEVKGPGDALQDNQKRWLRFFAASGIPHEVAWVNWSDD